MTERRITLAARIEELDNKELPQGIEIVQMTEDHVDEVIELGEKPWEINTGTESEPFFREETLLNWRDKGGVSHVALDNGKVVGFTLAYGSPANDGYLSTIVVDKRLRRRDIGSHLLTTSCSELKDMGCNRIFCVVNARNKKALRFFKENGFEYSNDELYHYLDTMLPEN